MYLTVNIYIHIYTFQKPLSSPRFAWVYLDNFLEYSRKGQPERIIAEDEWTPENIQKRYYSNRGAIYRIVSDRRKNKGFKAPRKSERYANLYFVGGSVNPGGGIQMVCLSGQHVKEKIVKEQQGK